MDMLAILIVMFSLLIWNKLPTWIVFVGTLTVAMTLRLAPEDELLKGFASSGVATVGWFSVCSLFGQVSDMHEKT